MDMIATTLRHDDVPFEGWRLRSVRHTFWACALAAHPTVMRSGSRRVTCHQARRNENQRAAEQKVGNVSATPRRRLIVMVGASCGGLRCHELALSCLSCALG